jgi:hypothetical protein
MKLSFNARQFALLSITALVIAYVRTFLQYHRYFWDSIGQFLASWLIHFVALTLFLMISGALIITKAPFFLENGNEGRKITVEEAIVYISLVLLMAAVSIFLLAHWVPVGTEDMLD